MHGTSRRNVTCLSSTLLLAAVSTATAQTPGSVDSDVRIGDGSGGFTGQLDMGDEFSASGVCLGDVDGDGVADLAVGSRSDDDGGTDRGAAWVLFMNADGTVRAHQKISATDGGFTGALGRTDRFGVAIAPLGDLDGDGVADLAVGASGDDDGSTNKGAVWVLFLASDGTVRAHQKISDTEGRFYGILDRNDLFGASVANMGDLNGDGVTDLAVGAPFDDDGGTDKGAAWLLFMQSDGNVQSYAKVSDTSGGFTGLLDRDDLFGEALTCLGDLDGDGTADLAIAARGDDDGGSAHGAVWVMFMNADGTVRAHQKISSTDGGFTGGLEALDYFGSSLTTVDDLDADGVRDLAVGAFFDDDGGTDRGAVWMLFMNQDGTVRAHQKISATEGGFTGGLGDGDWFGGSLDTLGDLDGDGTIEVAVGARKDDGMGSAWVLSIYATPEEEEEEEEEETCPPDLDGDGYVSAPDIRMLLTAWGPCEGCPEDLNGNDRVGLQDLLMLLRAWGSCEAEEAARPWRSRSHIRRQTETRREWRRSKRGIKKVHREYRRDRRRNRR